ncbi:MAG TPA: ABC transporter ATP-binding protein [Puia sp.]|nr:ABC transporter ATP-binding protein [Puia sp.]
MAVVIKVEQLSKAYQLGEIGTGTISRDLERWFARLRGKEDPFLKVGEVNDRTAKGESDIVWSLRDISFDVMQGESVGVIGRNGAGKSTLLKLLSRVTAPTTGLIKVKGRIASLLEVGTGFHPELTGKENVYLNGAILGMRKKEIERKFDEIVDFSGVERYIDTPVKRYSSGMYVRLAFAVAAYLESEILIVDEVLAVGDAEFQQKCLGKMKDVSSRQGRTVLFVSHNMSAVLNLCDKGVVLRNGQLDFCGNLREAVQRYQNSNMTRSHEWITDKSSPLPQIRYASLEIAENQPNLTLKIKVKIGSASNNSAAFIAFDIKNGFGTTIMQAIPSITPFLECDGKEKEYLFQVDLVGLIPDSYFVSIWIGPHNSETYDWQKDILSFEVQQSPTAGRTFPHHYDNGFIVPNSKIVQGI